MFPPEVLHTLDEGTSMYMIGSLKLSIGDIGPGKTLKNDIENLHHTIHHEIKKNSEQDFPTGSSRNGVLANTLVTATERRGNMFRPLCVCHTDQVRSRLHKILYQKPIVIEVIMLGRVPTHVHASACHITLSLLDHVECAKVGCSCTCSPRSKSLSLNIE
jgi:hypothetical protein